MIKASVKIVKETSLLTGNENGARSNHIFLSIFDLLKDTMFSDALHQENTDKQIKIAGKNVGIYPEKNTKLDVFNFIQLND